MKTAAKRSATQAMTIAIISPLLIEAPEAVKHEKQ